MRTTFKVAFYLRSNYENKEGKSPVMLRVFLNGVVSKKVCKLTIILIFALSNKKQQEYGTYTRTNFGNYFELHK